MKENFNFEQSKKPEDFSLEKYLNLARELSERKEPILFSGLETSAYQTLKQDEEDMPGFATPIDENIKKFEEQGLKVVLGKYPESGNIFILPFGSDDLENDSLFPRHLQQGEDAVLNELIAENLKQVKK